MFFHLNNVFIGWTLEEHFINFIHLKMFKSFIKRNYNKSFFSWVMRIMLEEFYHFENVMRMLHLNVLSMFKTRIFYIQRTFFLVMKTLEEYCFISFWKLYENVTLLLLKNFIEQFWEDNVIRIFQEHKNVSSQHYESVTDIKGRVCHFSKTL